MSDKHPETPENAANDKQPAATDAAAEPKAEDGKDAPVEEIGGQEGPEPTRYGDWEKNGIISDF